MIHLKPFVFCVRPTECFVTRTSPAGLSYCMNIDVKYADIQSSCTAGRRGMPKRIILSHLVILTTALTLLPT